MLRHTYAVSSLARRSSRSASAVAANRYSGIANGVDGALLLSSGLLAGHALTAGSNSSRKRLK